MKHSLALVAALLFAACGPEKPHMISGVEPAEEWLVPATPGGDFTALTIHSTPVGPAGRLLKPDGSAAALRSIQQTEMTLSFTVPALGASYAAKQQGTGRWAGEWRMLGAEPVELILGPSPNLPTPQDFAVLPDGRRMHIVCSGEGSPVVLLDYGAGGTMKRDWGDLATLAAEKAQTKVCAYDRAGRGLSDPAALPRDAAAVADDIDAMLTAANLPPPYILVGHSMGSYHIRQYANTRADRTAGLVLVDPSGDGQLARFNAVIPKVQQMQDEMFKAQAELQCITRLREKPVAPDDPFAQQCGGNDPEALLATKSEIDSMPGASTEQLTQSRRAYGAMPVIVLTRGDYEKDMPPNFTAEDRAAMKSVWESLHAEMAALSTAGEQRHIPGAGHYIQRDNPEAVLTAIADVVAKARQAP
jgi:pimeloyl-ACP methyl ester carboxylesterase